MRRIRRFLKESWRIAPGACVAASVFVIGLVAWVAYALLSGDDLSVLIGLLGWLLLSAAAVRFGSLWDLMK
jgi:uncharacterized BrkB/YihY/UPF0761 family membrane protein